MRRHYGPAIQPAGAITKMVFYKRRPTRNSQTTTYTSAIKSDGAPPIDQHAVDLYREFKRDMARCDERSCDCTCHCHAGAGECYQDDPKFGHNRRPNNAHRRAHRECPKEGREHNRK